MPTSTRKRRLWRRNWRRTKLRSAPPCAHKIRVVGGENRGKGAGTPALRILRERSQRQPGTLTSVGAGASIYYPASDSMPSLCLGTPLLAPTGRLVGRVEVWRGDVRLSMSVSAPFVWRCLSGSAVQRARRSRHPGIFPCWREGLNPVPPRRPAFFDVHELIHGHVRAFRVGWTPADAETAVLARYRDDDLRALSRREPGSGRSSVELRAVLAGIAGLARRPGRERR